MIDFARNRITFSELCGGNFGRKQIFTNVKSIDEKNIVSVLGKALSIHWKNRSEIKYLDKYYRGDQPILYKTKTVRPEINNKIVENHALEFVRFMTAQKFGEPIQYINLTKDDAKTTMVEKLNDVMRRLDKCAHDIELGEWQSICGTAYRFVWIDDDKECGFDFETLDPMDTFVVYSKDSGKKPLMGVQIIKDEDDRTMYRCYTNHWHYIIKNSKVVSSETVPNGIFRIPIIEFPNNSRRLSDIEIVITMLDAVNTMQSNRLNGIEQFVQAFMKFVNCEIDKDKFLEMCSLGAISIKGQNGVKADVDLISQELNQEQTQISKDDLYKNMLIVEGIPSREQNTGGDTGQAVYLRNGWDFAEQRAELMEPTIIKSEKKFLELVLYIFKTRRATRTDINLNLIDVDIKITRRKTDNMLVKTQALQYLLQCGINPKIAIACCEMFGDPEKVYNQSKDYLDVKYKTKEEIDKENEKILQQRNNKNQNGGGEDV